MVWVLILLLSNSVASLFPSGLYRQKNGQGCFCDLHKTETLIMEANGYPKISIVTPSFNQANFIEETIQSVLNQTYTNFEYIIVDGGSTDGSVEAIKKHEHKLAYWISEQDKGQSDAINKGFRRATGDVLCWVNSDDVLFSSCLEAIADSYVKNAEPDIIHAWGVYIDEKGKITRLMRVPRQSQFFFSKGMWVVPAPTVFFKACSFWKVGGVDVGLHLSMDLDLWVRMVKAGARVEQVPGYFGAFRRHNSSKTSISIKEKGSKRLEDPEIREIFDKALPHFPETRRRRWKIWWRLYQLVNFNYLRSYLECQSVKGRHWKEASRNRIRYG